MFFGELLEIAPAMPARFLSTTSALVAKFLVQVSPIGSVPLTDFVEGGIKVMPKKTPGLVQKPSKNLLKRHHDLFRMIVLPSVEFTLLLSSDLLLFVQGSTGFFVTFQEKAETEVSAELRALRVHGTYGASIEDTNLMLLSRPPRSFVDGERCRHLTRSMRRRRPGKLQRPSSNHHSRSG
jgi:hypothetical protein